MGERLKGVYLSMFPSYISSVNKFPGMNGLARKAALTRCLNSLWRLFPDEYNFYPRSWLLPEQRDTFLAECERRYLAAKQTEGVERAPWYIVKPDDGRKKVVKDR